MKVLVTIPHPHPNHEIQIGVSTWTENNSKQNQTQSIRRAVYNEEGKFSPHGSSEIPIEDMPLLIRTCLQRDLIENEDMINILRDISESMQRLR